MVGCGGTGSFVAEGLCRLLIGKPNHTIYLVDFDRVEEINLLRQNFHRDELGMFKAEALARRLSGQFGRGIAYSLDPFRPLFWSDVGVVIGCVDNHLARAEIAESVTTGQWWVDAGNDDEWGQVLVGNAADLTRDPRPYERRAFDLETGACHALPLPTVQAPALLAPPAPRAQDPDCAVAVEAGAQSPVINTMMAALVLQVVEKLLAGQLSWMAAYLNLQAGALRVAPASPATVSRMVGAPQRILVQRPGRRKGGASAPAS
jgi:hypothetical protein